MSPIILDLRVPAARRSALLRALSAGLLRRLMPGQVSVRWSFELQASVRVSLKRVRSAVART